MKYEYNDFEYNNLVLFVSLEALQLITYFF